MRFMQYNHKFGSLQIKMSENGNNLYRDEASIYKSKKKKSHILSALITYELHVSKYSKSSGTVVEDTYTYLQERIRMFCQRGNMFNEYHVKSYVEMYNRHGQLSIRQVSKVTKTSASTNYRNDGCPTFRWSFVVATNK